MFLVAEVIGVELAVVVFVVVVVVSSVVVLVDSSVGSGLIVVKSLKFQLPSECRANAACSDIPPIY